MKQNDKKTTKPSAAPSEPAPEKKTGTAHCPSPSVTEAFPLRIKGTLIQLSAEHDYEFRAQRQTGQSSQEVLQHTRDSKLYLTRGEKSRPKMVAYLTADSLNSDPLADLQDELERLVSREAPQKKARDSTRARTLLQTEHISVTLAKKARRIDASFSISIGDTPNYQQELINIMQKISSCFAINQNSLNQLRS